MMISPTAIHTPTPITGNHSRRSSTLASNVPAMIRANQNMACKAGNSA